MYADTDIARSLAAACAAAETVWMIVRSLWFHVSGLHASVLSPMYTHALYGAMDPVFCGQYP